MPAKTKASTPPPIPQSIEVGPATIRVTWSAEEWKDRHHPDDRLAWSSSDEALIMLNPDQSDVCMRDSLLHEVLHHVEYNAHVREIMAMAISLNDDVDEAMIKHQTPWFLMVLRDNPDLVAYLTEP